MLVEDLDDSSVHSLSILLTKWVPLVNEEDEIPLHFNIRKQSQVQFRVLSGMLLLKDHLYLNEALFLNARVILAARL